ncbi:MAG: hypothetical protein IPK32_08070 [Verrucomicrobiaceae bacterium]|nr:hypothetical protein [Verrucomicrobiaceae bacterium]
MNTDPSRREFVALSLASTLGCLSSCVAPSSSSRAPNLDYSYDQSGLPYALKIKPLRPDVLTPLAKSLGSFLDGSGRTSVSTVYSGLLSASKTDGVMIVNSDNRRMGSLTVTYTWRLPASGLIGVNVKAKLNGQPLVELPMPFSWPQTPIRLSTTGMFAFVEYNSGMNAPEIPFTASNSGETFKLKFMGDQWVSALGRQVPVWNWKHVSKLANRGGQSVNTTYDTMLSPKVPGQLLSYSYHKEINGKSIESSTGQLVSVS